MSKLTEMVCAAGRMYRTADQAQTAQGCGVLLLVAAGAFMLFSSPLPVIGAAIGLGLLVTGTARSDEIKEAGDQCEDPDKDAAEATDDTTEVPATDVKASSKK